MGIDSRRRISGGSALYAGCYAPNGGSAQIPFPKSQKVHSAARGNPHSFSGDSHSESSFLGYSGGQFGKAPLRPNRLAQTSYHPEQSCKGVAGCRFVAFWSPHLDNAYGMVAPNRRTARKPLQVLYRNRLQPVPVAGLDGPPTGQNTHTRSSRSRCPATIVPLHACRPLGRYDAMPPPLRKAHRALDDAVDKLYRSATKNFASRRRTK